MSAGTEVGEKSLSENSLKNLVECVKSTDNYLFIAMEGDRNNTHAIIQRGDFVRCYKALTMRLFDELYDECDFEAFAAIRVCDEIFNDCKAEWLSENSPEE